MNQSWVRDNGGRARILPDLYNCVECGKPFQRKHATKKVCCDGPCQAIRDRRRKKEWYEKNKSSKQK